MLQKAKREKTEEIDIISGFKYGNSINLIAKQKSSKKSTIFALK